MAFRFHKSTVHPDVVPVLLRAIRNAADHPQLLRRDDHILIFKTLLVLGCNESTFAREDEVAESDVPLFRRLVASIQNPPRLMLPYDKALDMASNIYEATAEQKMTLALAQSLVAGLLDRAPVVKNPRVLAAVFLAHSLASNEEVTPMTVGECYRYVVTPMFAMAGLVPEMKGEVAEVLQSYAGRGFAQSIFSTPDPTNPNIVRIHARRLNLKNVGRAKHHRPEGVEDDYKTRLARKKERMMTLKMEALATAELFRDRARAIQAAINMCNEDDLDL